MMIYVLIEHGRASPIGVFGTFSSADAGISAYYGADYELVQEQVVSDSGVEWHRWIRDSDGDVVELTLFSYWLDDV